MGKILHTLRENFDYIVCPIEKATKTDKLTVDAPQSSLLVHEQKLLRRRDEKEIIKPWKLHVRRNLVEEDTVVGKEEVMTMQEDEDEVKHSIKQLLSALSVIN